MLSHLAGVLRLVLVDEVHQEKPGEESDSRPVTLADLEKQQEEQKTEGGRSEGGRRSSRRMDGVCR